LNGKSPLSLDAGLTSEPSCAASTVAWPLWSCVNERPRGSWPSPVHVVFGISARPYILELPLRPEWCQPGGHGCEVRLEIRDLKCLRHVLEERHARDKLDVSQ
jgi:hypothetical protein